jgi:Cupin domain/Carboxypeptidase regulatory-like domain
MKARTLTAVVVLGPPITLAAQTAQPSPPTQPVPAAPSSPPRKPAVAARTPVEIRVTSRAGDVLAGVTVTANGSVERSGQTNDDGVLILKSVPPGQYRLRFTREGWITLERDVTVRGSGATRVEVELSPAEAPAPPPKPEPAPAPPPTPVPEPVSNVEPKTVVIPDFIDQNFLGRAPRKDSVLGCTATSKTTLMQLREPLAEHTHADGDEILYIVAGEATHKVGGRETRLEAGTYSLVPRGVPHSITRRGTNPIVLLSIETGQPCASAVTAR